MVDFDLILGMDWLHVCFASIDCRTRVVMFKFPNEPVLESIISSLKACRMISKECLYHII